MPAVTRSITLDAAPEEVWDAITDESLLREWLAPDVAFEAREGAEVECRYRGRRGAPRRGLARRGSRTPRLHLDPGRARREPGRADRRRGRRRRPPHRRRDRASPLGTPGRRRLEPVASRACGAASRALSTPSGRADAVFSALGDPTRRRLIEILSATPHATPTGLAGELPITRQAVAKHLAALSGAGLVRASAPAARPATSSTPPRSARRPTGSPRSAPSGTAGWKACADCSSAGSVGRTMASEYVFIDEWDVDAPQEEVFTALADASTYPEWWKPVYIEVETDGPPEPGRVRSSTSRGASPTRCGPSRRSSATSRRTRSRSRSSAT